MPDNVGWLLTQKSPTSSLDVVIPLIRNVLLARLELRDLALLRPHLIPVRLAAGQTLSEPGNAIEHVYFVEQGLVSLLADTGLNDAGIEAGMIGPEGLAGFSALLEPHPLAFHHTFVRSPATALRMQVGLFRRYLDSMPALREGCLSYLSALSAQISQVGACAGRHVLAERCASWLLAAGDRIGMHDMPFTHEAMAVAMGVRRASVSVALQSIQEAGLIRSGKGRVTVLAPENLEHAACDCYRLVRDQFDRLLTSTWCVERGPCLPKLSLVGHDPRKQEVCSALLANTVCNGGH